MTSGLASLQDAIFSSLDFRRYRCAGPLANRSEPFGFRGEHLHRAIMASRARVCKAWGNSKFEESPEQRRTTNMARDLASRRACGNLTGGGSGACCLKFLTFTRKLPVRQVAHVLGSRTV